MKNGKSYIHLLAGITLLYVAMRILIGINTFTITTIESALITAFLNLAFWSVMLYAIYLRKNKARIVFILINMFGIMACLGMYFKGQFGTIEILSAVYGLLSVFILSRPSLVNYMKVG